MKYKLKKLLLAILITSLLVGFVFLMSVMPNWLGWVITISVMVVCTYRILI